MARKKRKQHPERGPLPIDDRNSELERFSVDAVRKAFSPEKFIVRSEGAPDTGVDLTIELKARAGSSGFATGDRVSVQLKSCEKLKRSDGSSSNKCQKLSSGTVSYPVPTHNLNQLLNHHCPLYILYVHASSLLYFSWAWDEVRRIEGDGTDWKNQETVMIHFKVRLTTRTLKGLRTRIKAEAKVHRGISDVVSKSATKESVTIKVNLRDHSVSDPAEIKALLLKSGTQYIERGYGIQVLDLLDRLDSDDKKLPRMHLIRAFAEYSRGRYQQASGYISEALLSSAEFAEKDLLFLDLLRSACDFHTGVISMQEYNEKQKQLAEKGEGEFAVARKIDYLRNEYIGERDTDAKARILEDLRATVDKGLNLQNSSKEFRIMARTALIFADGAALARTLLETLGHIVLPLLVGHEPRTAEIFTRMTSQISEWFTKANLLMRDALALGNAQLAADAIEAVAHTIFVMRLAPWVGRNLPSDGLYIKNETIKTQVMPNLRVGIGLFQKCDNIQGVLRLKLLLANCAALIGEKGYAIALAEEVLKPASDFRFKILVEQAQRHINGQPFYMQTGAELLDLGREDADVRGAREDDLAVKRNAKRTLEALNLPSLDSHG